MGGDLSTVAPPAKPEVLGSQALVLAVLLGILASRGAAGYPGIVTAMQEFLWNTLPDNLGYPSTPAWMVLPLLLIGSGIVALAWRLPGAAGEGPLTALHFNVTPLNA